MLYYATVGRAYLKVKLITFSIINTNGPVLFFIYVSKNTKTPIVNHENSIAYTVDTTLRFSSKSVYQSELQIGY